MREYSLIKDQERRRQILGVLAAESTESRGLTSVAIAERLAQPLDEIRALLNAMRKDTQVEEFGYLHWRTSEDNKLWGITDWGRQGYRDQRCMPKERKCLGGCGKMFWSGHAGNRVCFACSEKAIYNGGDVGTVSYGGFLARKAA